MDEVPMQFRQRRNHSQSGYTRVMCVSLTTLNQQENVMSQKATKHEPSRVHHSAVPAKEAGEIKGKNILTLGEGGVENLIKSANKCGKVAGELSEMCSGDMEEFFDAGRKSLELAQEMNREAVECCSHIFSEYANMVSSLPACRNMGDMLTLQTRTAEQVSGHALNAVGKLYSMAFDSYSDAVEPLNELALVRSKKIQEVLAA